MERIILHIDMDAFFAAIEERDNPQFKGKPIIVGADPKEGKGRGVVSTANYEARKYGIHSAMPISWAYRRLPQATFLPVDMEKYQSVSERVMGIIRGFADKPALRSPEHNRRGEGGFEQVSVDEAYLEISNFKFPISNWEKVEEIAKRIKEEIWEKEKLTCSIGIGPNKLIAKLASGRKKPDGLTIIKPEEVLDFLSASSVDELPGVGPKTNAKLNRLGIYTIGQLRKYPRDFLAENFGKFGFDFWEMARGIDEGEVGGENEIKSVGRQTTFEKDLSDPKEITAGFLNLADQVWRDLKEEGFGGKTITIIVRYENFETHTKANTLKTTISDFKTLKVHGLKLLLPYLLRKRPIRLVGVRISSLTKART